MSTASDNSSAPDQDTASSAAGIPLGASLKRAREARGMSAKQVAQSLRLDLHVIEALERDDYARLPALTFVRGYLHNYARLVGMDEGLIAQALPDAGATPAQALQRRAIAQRRPVRPGVPWGRWLRRLVLLALLAALALWLFPHAQQWWQARTAAEAPDSGAQLQLPESPAGPASTLALPEPVPPEPVEEPETVLPLPAPASIEPTPAAAPEVDTVVPTPVPAPAPVPTPTATEQVDLVLTFGEDSWAEVRDSRGRLLYEMVRAGMRKELKGVPPFRLLLGNSPGVQVEYRGRPFDHAPHSRGNVARFTLE